MPNKTIELPGFAVRIKAVRLSKRLSQRELGERCGWKKHPQSRVAWIEGGREPSYEDISRIAQELDVTVPYLLLGESTAPISSRSHIPLVSWQSMRPRGRVNEKMLSIIWPITLSARAFAVVLEDDVYAPSFVKGTILIIDPDSAPVAGNFVVLDLGRTTYCVCDVIENGESISFRVLGDRVKVSPHKLMTNRVVGVVRSRIDSF